MKGQMIGSRGLDGDIHIAHSVHAASLQSGVSTRKQMWASWNWFPNSEQFLMENALRCRIAHYLKLRAFSPTFQMF